MEISRYWHKETRSVQSNDGRTYELTSWGGSSANQAEARQNALQKLDRWMGDLYGGRRLDEYEYGVGRLREEVIEEICDAGGQLIGAVTRNRYGVLVLNCTNVLIADIDIPVPGLFARLGALFGRPVRDKQFYIERVSTFAARHPEYTLELYETHAGLRIFLTSHSLEPTSDQAAEILEQLDSDRLYRRLCVSQGCFRARLTPKPWRCGMLRPPYAFPRQTPEEQGAFDRWLLEYTRKAKDWGVCRHLATLGPGDRTDHAERLLSIHDATVLNAVDTALA